MNDSVAVTGAGSTCRPLAAPRLDPHSVEEKMMEVGNEDEVEDASGQPEDAANKGLIDKLLGKKKEVRR